MNLKKSNFYLLILNLLRMAERLKITEFRVFRDDLDMKLNKIMTTHESNKIK